MCCQFVSESVAAEVLNVLVTMCSLYTGTAELDTAGYCVGASTHVHIVIIIIIIYKLIYLFIYYASAFLRLACVGIVACDRTFAS